MIFLRFTVLLITLLLCNISFAKVGGDFSLKDHNNQVFTHKNLLSKKSLVYFGYTFCPDFCPASLNNISLGLADFSKEELEQVNIVFITIDPERDTQKVLNTYMQNFHPKIIALTGTKSEIDEVIGKFKIYAAKVENTKNPHLYTMNHTTLMFIFDESGELITAIPHDEDLSSGKLKSLLLK